MNLLARRGRLTLGLGLACVAASLPPLQAGAQDAASVPIPTWKLAPRTAASVPLGTVVLAGAPALQKAPHENAVALDKYGYVEEEYLLSGAANLYAAADGNAAIKGFGFGAGQTVATANVPYTTRMIVRRPADPAHFFGTIQIEPLRDGDEGAAIWDMAWPALIANGEVWVGFTVSKSDATAMQEKFDRSRYAPLKIADDGQRWDIMTQVAAVLQSPDGPLGKLKFVEQANKFQGLLRLYSSGWSLTGCMQAEFINKGHHAAARLPNGDPLISGYLAGGCPQIAIDAAPKDVAVIEAVSESAYLSPQDAEKTLASRHPDGNKIGENRYRWYELAGTGDIEYRDLPSLSIAAYQMGAASAGVCAKPAKILPGKSDFVRAMLANLDDWIRFGIRGPVGKVFDLGDDHKIKRDANGNALGGLRPYWVEVPTTRFVAAVADSPDRNPTGATCSQIGHEEPLPAQELATLYKDRADYATKITKYLDQSIKDRVLLLADGEAERDRAVGAQSAPNLRDANRRPAAAGAQGGTKQAAK